MKITIEFSNEEKQTIIETMMEATGATEYTDKSEHIKGNFGEVKYSCCENELVLDLKTGFIKATYKLLLTAINMIKSLISTCEIFSSSWFEDVEDLNERSEKDCDERIKSK